MKMTKWIALLLCALMCVSVFAGCNNNTPNETEAPETDAPVTDAPETDAPKEPAKLTATWTYENGAAGIADGSIKIFSETNSGSITVNWGADGKPLPGYAPIGSGLMRKNVESTIEFPTNTLIPVGATEILVFLANISTEIPEAVIEIDASKQSGKANETPKYTVGIVSDVLTDGEKYAKALNYFKEQGVSAVVVIGDFVGFRETWQINDDPEGVKADALAEFNGVMTTAADAIANLGAPIYYVSGENDMLTLYGDPTLPTAFGITEEENIQYYEREIGGDVFLFVGSSQKVHTKKVYDTEAAKFLRSKLKEYEDRNVYLFTQFPLKGTVGNIAYGEDYLYPSDELSTTVDSQFKRYLKEYENLVHISAETGFSYTLTQYDKNLVCSLGEENAYSPMLHVPALTPVVNTGTSLGDPDAFMTEGAILAVYEGHAELLAVDVEAKTFITPACVYIEK